MRHRPAPPPLDAVFGAADVIGVDRVAGQGPAGRLPLTPAMLVDAPSGDLFGLTQNVGMGWSPASLGGPEYVIVSTAGGIRAEDGRPIALGYHTGHWEIGLLVREPADTLRSRGGIPFAGFCSDPCDGRTQGTTGMFDSLAYRNDAAIVMRRLIRSLPTASGVMGVATCDKGLPATMLALAGCGMLPGVGVPGGVTFPTLGAEDAGQVQSLGARFSRDLVTLDYAAEMGRRACGLAGGGCQFLGTAATSQVVAEALGLAVPHSALAPSGEPSWFELGRRSALALLRLHGLGIPLGRILTPEAIENAMLVHAAFGGSTNLLLHIPAIAHAGGLTPPTVDDWIRVNRATPRLVDALPNGPRGHPTVQVFMAGGVPEVMLQLRAPEGSVIKATAIDASVVGEDQVYQHRGPARVFVDERDAIRAVKGTGPDGERAIAPGDVIVLIGNGPSGTGMQETAQITTALRYLPWGKHVALVTDGRFSGFSSGACVGHVGPEALAGGPIAKVRDGDLIEIVIDRTTLEGSVNLVGVTGEELAPERCSDVLRHRPSHPRLAPHPLLPDDTRLWAALRRASGGTWAGCVYDVDRIIQALDAADAGAHASPPSSSSSGGAS